MGIEESKEVWTRVDLYCDGIGDGPESCVEYGDPEDIDAEMPVVTDCCQSAEDARRLTLYAATECAGWRFDMKLQRWLCPACVKALQDAAA
jgi:hypothetical protein